MEKLLFCVLFIFLFAGNAHAAPAKLASGFSAPTGIAQGSNGLLYVTEWGANQVAALAKDGASRVAASNISAPAGICFDNAGNLYVAGYGDGNIYILKDGGKLDVLASGFSQPTGIFWTKDNTLLVANRGAGEIVEVYPNGRKAVISSGHNLPVGIVRTDNGNLFVSCFGGNVDYIPPNGQKTSLRSGFSRPGVGIAPAGGDSVYCVDNAAGKIFLVDKNGIAKQIADNLSQPVALARLANGQLVVGNWGDGALYQVEVK